MSKFKYKVIDYANIEHHNNLDVENVLNNLGLDGYELVEVLDMGENNTNKEGKVQDIDMYLKKL